MTLLAMSAFVPIWEIAQVGRQLADSLGAARRLHAIHGEPVPVADGPGAMPREGVGVLGVELDAVTFTYPGRLRPALDASRSPCRPAPPPPSSGPPARARARWRRCCSASGIRIGGRSGSAATTRAAIASTISAGGWRWSHRTRTSSTSACGDNVALARPDATPRGYRSRGGAGCAGRVRGGVAGRARHRGGRARDAALRGPAPARRHRAGVSQGRPRPRSWTRRPRTSTW